LSQRNISLHRGRRWKQGKRNVQIDRRVYVSRVAQKLTHHTVYLQVVAPTGRYETGFFPIIGLHDEVTKLQFNGAAGFTFNFENTATDYQSGDEFHFEWAIGEAPFAWGFFF
jgi:hypothetical protein